VTEEASQAERARRRDLIRRGEVVPRRTGIPPDDADLVYAHRPVAELPGIVMLAQRLGATAIWHQSGLAEGGGKDPRGCWLPDAEAQAPRDMAESAGLAYLAAPYIADEVRRLGTGPAGGR
jgi:hypothetical protein